MSEKKDSNLSPRYTNGPVVKTGPTSGQNRSRNKDGPWRAKRSDSGQSRGSKKSGCFITTAACTFKGLPDDCEQLQVLRHFRDRYLLSTSEGRAMVDHYYAIAPELAERLTHPKDLELVWGVVLQCVDAIKSDRSGEAFLLYKSIVELLQDRFPDPSR